MAELSLLEAAFEMLEAEVRIRVLAHEALERVAVKVEKTAKDEIGIYQEAIGPFPAWPELADATKEDRLAKGFSENDPLLRTGELRDSIQHTTGELETQIGSDSDIMIYQELGTARIPPRPVLGPAAERNHDVIMAELGGAVVAGLIGQRQLAPLFYDNAVTS